MNKWQETKIKSLQEIPEVKEHPIKLYKKPTGYKAIVNVETEDTLSIVNDNYQLAQHRDIYSQVAKYKDYKIDNGVIYNNGRVMVLEVVQAVPTKVELIPGDKLEPRVRIFNSYDLSKALSVQSYGIRLVCTNGMIAPGMVDRWRRIHTFNNISIPEIGDRMKLAMAAWVESGDLLMKSTEKKVVVVETLGVHKFLPKRYTKIALENLGAVENEKKEASVYDIWNELTRLISHEIKDREVQVSTLIAEQRFVNKIFDLVRE